MDIEKKISSMGFFVFSLVIIGVLIGFSLAFFSFSYNSSRNENIARAQDLPSVIIPQDALLAAEGLQAAFNAISEKTLPSVVEVKTVAAQRRRSADLSGMGSGIIIRYDNGMYYVLTNNHVIDRAAGITVATIDGKDHNAELVGRDARRDLAILSFRADGNFPLADMGDSDAVKVGDWAIAMGNPLGERFAFSVTLGIVSAVGRSGGPGGNILDFIQTDASIIQGNSGGPLVNLRGEVIGINTWIASNAGGGFIGLGFAIPINNAIQVIDDLIATGSVNDGWLGISLYEPERDMIENMGLSGRRGALVVQVSLGSPADRSGIRAGDFITHVDNIEMRGANHLINTVGSIRPGNQAVFRVFRDGVSIDFNAQVLARSSNLSGDNQNLWPGLMVFTLTDVLRSNLNLPDDAQGLLVGQIISGTPAAVTGLRQGDRIIAINGIQVHDQASFYRVLRENAERELWFTFIRGGDSQESQRFRR